MNLNPELQSARTKLSWLQTSLARVAALVVSGLLAALPADLRAAAFTAGNIVVYRVGSGTGSLVNTGNPVFVDEYTTSGALVQSVALPTTKSGLQYQLVASGTATSEGLFTRSADGRYLLPTGYGTNIGGASLPGTASAAVQRVIGRVDAFGNVDTSTGLADWTTANNPRSATSVDGSAVWGGGAAGLNYAIFGATTSAPLTNQNTRCIGIYSNQLYITTSSSGKALCPVGSGLPTSGTQPLATLPGIADSSPYGFVFFTLNGGAGPDTVYIADDNTNGVLKYCLVSGSWVNKGVIPAASIRGLVGVANGTTVTLYGATGGSTATGGGSIYALTDTTGYNTAPSGTSNTIATAAANTAFRGIAFTPVAYTVTYLGNGNTGGSVPVDSAGYAGGATVTVQPNSGNLTLTGATFAGWNTAANGSGTTYTAGTGTFTITSNTTLYAVWVLAPTYTVTYLGNGNTGGTVPVDKTAYASGATVTVMANTGGLTETGFGFGGWNTASDGSGTSYAASGAATFTMGSANVTLYAVWTQNPSLTVSGGPLNFGAVAEPSGDAVLTYTVSGANLQGNILIAAPANFEVSIDNSTFSGSASLTPSGGTVALTTIYVLFSPTAQQVYTGAIVANTSSGATEQDVAVSGTGATAPSVTTQAANPTNTTGATLNGSVTANNGAAITDRGFYWSASAKVGVSANQLDEGGASTGAFSKAIPTGTLSPNTIYYYRAYAVNSFGTALDTSDTSFYTLASTPTAPTVNGATATTLNVTLGSGDGNPSTTTYAIEETSTSTYVQANGALVAAAPVYQTSSAWGTVTVNNLTHGNFYTFQAKAHNGAGVDSAFGPGAGAGTVGLPFTPADLVVERLGNGTETLSSSGNSIFMDEFTAAGAPVQSIEIPNNGPSALIETGTAASDGGFTRSSDGLALCVPGYNVNLPYSSSVASAAGTAVPRGVGIVNSSGAYSLAATSTTADSGNNIRGAAADDAGNYWCSGGATGINYLGSGTPASVYSTVSNLRCINLFGANLWYDTASGSTTRGIWEFAGAPTITATSTQIITLGANDSPYNFSIDNAANPNMLFYSDDGTQGTGSGAGIHKWTNGASGWAPAYVVYSASGVYGLAVDYTTTPATIYATTTNSANNLIKVVDNGSSSTATVLATAAAGEFYRGIAFTPKGGQTISPIAGTATETYGSSSYSVATTASSGLAVSYLSDNTAVATVDSTGEVTILGAGTAHILANQTGNIFYTAAAQVSQTLTVNPLPIILTGSRTYDGTSNAPASVLMAGNNLDGTNLTLSGSAVLAGDNTGLQAVNDLSGLTLGGPAAGNYTLTGAYGLILITGAPLLITANPQTITYGASVPATTVTYSGFVIGETNTALSTQPTITSALSGVAAAGTYNGNYTVSGAVDANYSISYAAGALTVNPAALAITASPQSKTYGQTLSFGAGSTQFTSSGLQNGDAIGTVTLAVNNNGGAAAALVSSSPYTITPSAATGGTFTAANYAITYASGNLTVNPAALTITASSQNKTYGQTLAFGAGSAQFTSSGLQNGDTVGSVTLAVNNNGGAAAALVSSSPYTITPSAATGGTFTAANYAIAYASGNLTVSPAALTITASSQSKTYGQTMTFGSGSTLFTSSGLQNGETIGTVTLAVSGNGGAATAPVSGSPYTITPSAATGGTFTTADYAITYASGNLTVSPAALTITASSQSKTYGQTMTFGSGSTLFTGSGLQNGETIGTVTLAVSGNGGAATAPVSGSPYTITPSAATGGTFVAGNYAITYLPGNLTVNPASGHLDIAGVTLSGSNLVFTGTNGVAGGTYYTLMSPDISLTPDKWPAVQTNVLIAYGNFTITVSNTVTTGAPVKFYILKTQ